MEEHEWGPRIQMALKERSITVDLLNCLDRAFFVKDEKIIACLLKGQILPSQGIDYVLVSQLEEKSRKLKSRQKRGNVLLLKQEIVAVGKKFLKEDEHSEMIDFFPVDESGGSNEALL